MIDVIINTSPCLTIAHDEKDLDVCEEALISRSTGEIILKGPGLRKSLGNLKKSLLEHTRNGMEGQIIRFSGWSFAKIGRLIVRITD